MRPSGLEDPGILELDLLTWNVHGWVGLDLRRDPGRIFAWLRRLGADVVGLQEVEGRDWLELARAAGYHVTTGCLPGRGDFGNALLTRAPPLRCRQIDLSVGGGREERCALDALLALGGSETRRLRVVTTHLGLRATERRRQARRLAAHLARVDTLAPVVVMGDLNDWTPWGAQLAPLAERVGRFSRERTFPSRRPVFPLDRVACRIPGARSRVEVLRAPGLRAASDHLPLRLALRLGASAGAGAGARARAEDRERPSPG
ncbi:MAG: endonuclease/exonuclease/phosphatase family protein [Spirochaetaceae bacterium]|nr:endonuclease/exonuclease/phosphatase family protein [Myxococcales bacterium]MCB9724002.1 endonuclease/exonuclease/phosphatase family protein [Spirochaetaceae bacterium]HPG26319.1 endonuclease/exonuclease/phosphatase family protein [Myxococcota bacterium]